MATFIMVMASFTLILVCVMIATGKEVEARISHGAELKDFSEAEQYWYSAYTGYKDFGIIMKILAIIGFFVISPLLLILGILEVLGIK